MISSPRSPQLHQTLSQGRLLRFNKDEIVSNTDDNDTVMLVAEGYVKRYFITNSGSLGVQIVYGPQDVFSLTGMFALLLGQHLYDGPETYYYKTMSDVQLYTIESGAFAKQVGDNPGLYKDLFAEAGHHLKACVHNIENMSLVYARSRVAHQLLFFANEFGKKTPEGTQLDLPLTQQDLADMLGMARETVTKSVNKLRERGILTADRHFCIADLPALQKMAYR